MRYLCSGYTWRDQCGLTYGRRCYSEIYRTSYSIFCRGFHRTFHRVFYSRTRVLSQSFVHAECTLGVWLWGQGQGRIAGVRVQRCLL